MKTITMKTTLVLIFLFLVFASNFSIAQNPTIISDSLVIMNRVYAKEKLIVDQEAKFKQDIKVLGNARIHTDLRVDGELRVEGTTKLNGNVKMTNLGNLESLFNDTEIVFILPNGQLNKGPVDSLITQIYKEGACNDGGNILNPTWSNGLNKIFTACPQVKVGIGTNNPAYILDIKGMAYVDKLKVGTTSAIENAMINGYDLTNSRDLIQLGLHNPTTGNVSDTRFLVRHNGSVFSKTVGSNTAFEIRNGTGHAVVIYGNGGSKIFQIEDDGLLRTREVRIDAASWADYVFEKNYELPKLKDLAKFIDLNHHLPGIPSSKEIKENGINVGEMQTLQMQKLEELTLYLIEMDEKMDLMQTEINSLKEENQKLKNK